MTTTRIKLLALLLMVVDHIWLFFEGIPIWFCWLGRLSAPLFIFCLVQGFSHTRNRGKYLMRLYISGAGMAVMNHLLYLFTDEIIENNVFVTLFAIAISIQLIDHIRERHPKWKSYLGYFCIWQGVTFLLEWLVDWYGPGYLTYFTMGFAGNIFFNEGRIVYVLLGVLMYYVKESKIKLSIFYTLYCGLYAGMIIFNLVPRLMMRFHYYGWELLHTISSFFFGVAGFNTFRISEASILYVRFQWMMLGALPIMLLYNGRKGKGMKYLFYIFYPAHIFILVILSYLL